MFNLWISLDARKINLLGIRFDSFRVSRTYVLRHSFLWTVLACTDVGKWPVCL